MKRKILIIEDELGIRENLQLLLEANGYEVFSAANGSDGIKAAKEILPELIVCDVMMPQADGYEVLQTLSGDDDTRFIPFLFLTAKVERTDIRKGMQLGADDYLLKPYDADELLEAVKSRLMKFDALQAHFEKNSDSEGRYTPEDKLQFSVRNSRIFVPIKKILYFSADRQYSSIHTMQKHTFIAKKTLADWEAVLPEGLFIRIHRSTLVNSEYIERIEKVPPGAYKLHLFHCDSAFEVSRRCYKNLVVAR